MRSIPPVIFKNDLNVKTLAFNQSQIYLNDETDLLLLSQIILKESSNDKTSECKYFIEKYERILSKEISDHSFPFLKELRDEIIMTEIRVKIFYDFLSKVAKNEGYLVQFSKSVYDSSLYNCKSISDLTSDLTAENRAQRDIRVITALAILPAVGFALPSIKEEIFPNLSYGHTLLTFLFMVAIGAVIISAELYRSHKIKRLALQLKRMLVTYEKDQFSFYELNLAVSHLFCLKTALNNMVSKKMFTEKCEA